MPSFDVTYTIIHTVIQNNVFKYRWLVEDKKNLIRKRDSIGCGVEMYVNMAMYIIIKVHGVLWQSGKSPERVRMACRKKLLPSVFAFKEVVTWTQERKEAIVAMVEIFHCLSRLGPAACTVDRQVRELSEDGRLRWLHHPLGSSCVLSGADASCQDDLNAYVVHIATWSEIMLLVCHACRSSWWTCVVHYFLNSLSASASGLRWSMPQISREASDAARGRVSLLDLPVTWRSGGKPGKASQHRHVFTII